MHWASFLLLGCIGVTTEVFFTALSEFLAESTQRVRSKRSAASKWILKGHSYLWMFPVYGSIAWIGPPLLQWTLEWPVFPRAIAYGVLILTVEFILGALLTRLIGRCPWEYQKGWHIKGWIRLDYLPFWMGFGLAMEWLLLWMAKLES